MFSQFLTMNIFYRVLFILLLTRGQFVGSSEYRWLQNQRASTFRFNYNNPDEWGSESFTCWGARQSPIDINSTTMANLGGDLLDGTYWPKPLVRKGYENIPLEMTLQNNGHSVVVSAIYDDYETPSISGGVLEGDYTFAQFHFHWGSSNKVGSEHTIDGEAFPLELHIVHYKTEYGTFSDALKQVDGLAVVGVFYEIDEKRDTNVISKIQRQSNEIREPNTEVEINELFSLSELNVNFQDYVTYLGSLTTPPCTEVVTWIVSGEMNYVTSAQMDVFRQIRLAYNDDHNYRPTLPLHGRTVSFVSALCEKNLIKNFESRSRSISFEKLIDIRSDASKLH